MQPVWNHKQPPAVVLSCRGASEGALSVVRTLGRRGVVIQVVSDDATSFLRASRYCRRFVHIPGFSQDAETTEVLLRLGRQFGARPVLFPTADPDVLFVARNRDVLESVFDLVVPPRPLVDVLIDKRRFAEVSREMGFPTPATWVPVHRDDVVRASRELEFPVILKPAQPLAWTTGPVREIVGSSKALVIRTPVELEQAYAQIAPRNDDLLIQEYIPGPDDAHHSMHAYWNRQGQLMACFTGRRIRLHPPGAGSGCFVRSMRVPEIVRSGIEVLESLDYRGIAVLNYKQDARTGEYRLHEINPRISQWNLLATACGVNVPWLAFADTAGLEVEPCGTQRENLQYVDLQNDLRSFREYRKRGIWDVRSYASSLLSRRTIHQNWAWDDLGPLLLQAARMARRRLFWGGVRSETVGSDPGFGSALGGSKSTSPPAAPGRGRGLERDPVDARSKPRSLGFPAS